MRASRRSFMLALLLASAPAAAFASPPAHGAEAEDKDKDVARSVELGGLVFPVFSENGKLQNYLFVNARMRVADGKDPWKYREQAHFIRDAVIRAAHKTSFNTKGDTKKLDEKLAEMECLKAANASLGEASALISMTFTQIASQQ